MIKFLIFNDETSAQARALALSLAMGFPDAATQTAAYTRPIPHPQDARAALPVGTSAYSRVADALINPCDLLTAGEQAALKTFSWVKTEGWFATVGGGGGSA